MSGLLTIGRPAVSAGRRTRTVGAATTTAAAALAILAGALAAFFPLNIPREPAAAPPFEEVTVPLSDGRTLEVGRYEVTFDLWRRCHADGGCDYLPKPGRRNGSEGYPVTGINPFDIQQFIAWLNDRTGLGYRLPTLAEWREYAGVPAGETKRKLFDDPRLAWAADYGTTRTMSRRVRPSGHFGLARSGVADIDGNVWEWTSSCVSTVDSANCPAFYAAGQDHIAEIPVFLRDAYGGGCSAGTPPANLGFRLVRD